MVEDLIIKDRRHLSEDGIVLPIIAINKLSGRVESSPEIVTRGFDPGEDGFVDGARRLVMQTLRIFERRRKGRLRRDQGKNPRGLEALYFEADAKEAADHAGDIRDLSSLGERVCPAQSGEARKVAVCGVELAAIFHRQRG